jgi:hypothetical protein
MSARSEAQCTLLHRRDPDRHMARCLRLQPGLWGGVALLRE